MFPARLASAVAVSLAAIASAGRAPAEAADVASPRTGWSIKGKKEIGLFHACHASHVAHADAYTAAPAGGVRLALIGDSQTEAWTGHAYCRKVQRARDAPAVLARTLAARWRDPVVLGISADQTQHLMWRLQNGELSRAMAADPGLVSVLTIGTNNLGNKHTVTQTAAGIDVVARLLLNSTRGSLLVNGLLPRGDGASARGGYGGAAVAVGTRPNGKPLRSFLPAVAAVNALLRASIERGSLARDFRARVAFVDCGARFLAPAGAPTQRQRGAEGAPAEVDPALMPDRLHPSGAGHELWAACLTPYIAAAEARRAVSAG